MVLCGHGVGVPTEHLLIISPALIITTAKCTEPQLIKTLHFFCLSFMGKESEEVKLKHKGPQLVEPGFVCGQFAPGPHHDVLCITLQKTPLRLIIIFPFYLQGT